MAVPDEYNFDLKNRLYHQTRISISAEEFQFITHTKSYAIGDYSESFEVESDTICYQRIAQIRLPQ